MPLDAPSCPIAAHRAPHATNLRIGQRRDELSVERPRPGQQVLQRRWDPTFSEHSYGFRPGRSAHHAIAQAQQYIAAGCGYVVDLDLEKFFDRVNHDRLMGQVARRVADTRLLTLIRAFLNAGVRENGLVGPRVDEGVPQGGPLSPVLSNLVLDELDRELERRGHRFVRYADDCNVYVGSARAGQRVMESVPDARGAYRLAGGLPRLALDLDSFKGAGQSSLRWRCLVAPKPGRHR